MNEDRYYDSLQAKHEEEAKVPFSDFKALEQKIEETEKEYCEFKEDITNFILDNDIIGATEYLKARGCF